MHAQPNLSRPGMHLEKADVRMSNEKRHRDGRVWDSVENDQCAEAEAFYVSTPKVFSGQNPKLVN